MHDLFPILGLTLFAFVLNLPLGYQRQNYEKFSFGWYFYVHISIPVIIYARIKSGYDWHMIPLTLAGAVAGQIVGGRLHRKRHRNG